MRAAFSKGILLIRYQGTCHSELSCRRVATSARNVLTSSLLGATAAVCAGRGKKSERQKGEANEKVSYCASGRATAFKSDSTPDQTSRVSSHTGQFAFSNLQPTRVEVLLCLDGWLPYILRASLGCWRVAQNRDVQEALRP